jgi:hypothetical protein
MSDTSAVYGEVVLTDFAYSGSFWIEAAISVKE